MPIEFLKPGIFFQNTVKLSGIIRDFNLLREEYGLLQD